MRKTFVRTIREMKVQFLVLLLVWIIYSGLTLLAPAAQATTRYGISLFWTNILRTTILLPYLFIWVSALFSILRFTKYLKFISQSPECAGFKYLIKGLWMLLAVVIVPSYIGILGSYFPENFFVQKITTILRNDATILIYLCAFYFLWQGSKKLGEALITEKIKDKASYFISVLLTIVLGIGYIWFVIHNPFRTASSNPLVKPTYYLSDISIFLTIVFPYIVIWLLGFLTIFNFRNLSKKIVGVIYKNAFHYISKGITVIIALIISLQFLSQASIYLASVHLGIILVIIYLILIAIALGYLYIARGAKELTLIEEA